MVCMLQVCCAQLHTRHWRPPALFISICWEKLKERKKTKLQLTFGFASSIRVANSSDEKPPKTTEWIAPKQQKNKNQSSEVEKRTVPSRAHASMATKVWGIAGLSVDSRISEQNGANKEEEKRFTDDNSIALLNAKLLQDSSKLHHFRAELWVWVFQFAFRHRAVPSKRNLVFCKTRI